jgi:predicted nucleic acid-binding protein
MSAHHELTPSLSGLPQHLHAGEVQAIQLACHRQIPLVLLDDFEARRAAERQGLKVVGTLRILAEGSLAGLLSLSEAFEKLKQTNFRASERLYASLLAEVESRR